MRLVIPSHLRVLIVQLRPAYHRAAQESDHVTSIEFPSRFILPVRE